MAKALIQSEFIIAVDFDGTITNEQDISEDTVLTLRDNCKRVLQRLHNDGVKLILWTCRTEKHLEDAKAFLFKEELLGFFTTINDHIKEVYDKYPVTSRKVGADMYLEDKAFGVNLDTLWLDVEKHIYGEEE